MISKALFLSTAIIFGASHPNRYIGLAFVIFNLSGDVLKNQYINKKMNNENYKEIYRYQILSK